jgi:hypothetical protein
VWSFHVVSAGEGRCRLIARSRTEAPAQVGLWIAGRIGEPVTLVMTRRMLRGLKAHAERRSSGALGPGSKGPSAVAGRAGPFVASVLSDNGSDGSGESP